MSPAPVYAFLFAGFANRLFQVASALGLARRLGRPFKLLAYHHNIEHGGQNYADFFARAVAPGDPMPPCLPDRNVAARLPHVCDAAHILADDSRTFMNAIETLGAPGAINSVPESQAIVLNGYFQNESNFVHVREELLTLFRPPTHITELLDTLPGSESLVAVHVRLGDAKFNPMLNFSLRAYYDRAIAVARAAIPGARFIIVTDEPANVFRYYPNLRDSDDDSGNGGEIQVLDHPDDQVGFYLMTRCRGVVCANSTFSWWAAWLNARPDKVVCVPKPWAVTLPHLTMRMAGAHEVEV